MILLLSVWGPRIRLIVRLMLVSFLCVRLTGSPEKSVPYHISAESH